MDALRPRCKSRALSPLSHLASRSHSIWQFSDLATVSSISTTMQRCEAVKSLPYAKASPKYKQVGNNEKEHAYGRGEN